MPRTSESYHYIIVGGGSAGCVLANRLSADAETRVALIESGPPDTSLKVRMPAAAGYAVADTSMNWHYYTEPQVNMDGRRLMWPRGRLLGGCSSHNTMVFIRGHARDYDHWRQLGCEGWAYRDVLPYFKRLEQRSVGEDDYRGGSGEMRVKPADNRNPLPLAYIEAAQQAGFAFTPDFNGRQQEGVGRFDLNIDAGRRCNTAWAYLRPVRQRMNLEVRTQAHVTRVLIEGGRATGVEIVSGGRIERLAATGEVILCGGAINSPQLLMLSGIGDPDHLRSLGIDVVVALPGVGANLQDHLEVSVQQACLTPDSLYGSNRIHRAARIGLEWLLLGTGDGSTSHFEAGAFLRTNEAVETPDIQQHFVPILVLDHGMTWPDRHGYQSHVSQMRPESRGHIQLRSSDPFEHPMIEPGYLHSDEDVRCLREGVRVTREIFSQSAFEKFRGEELAPGPGCETDRDIDAFVRRTAETGYHPCGTCKMGVDAGAVVDCQLRVKGIDSLRVVDASVIPAIVTGNLNAPTIMIAEKGADLIRGATPPASLDADITGPIPRRPAATALAV